MTATHQSYDQGIVMANKLWWDTLTPEQQRVIKDAFFPIQNARADIRELIKTLKADLVSRGTAIHTLTRAQRAVWMDATAPAHAAILTEIGGRAVLVYNAIQEGKREFAVRARNAQ